MAGHNRNIIGMANPGNPGWGKIALRKKASLLFRRSAGSVRNQGLRITAVKVFVIVTDFWFDFRNRLDTTNWVPLDELTIRKGAQERSVPYQPTRVLPLRKLFRDLVRVLPQNSTLLDIGCGKGRVLLIASEFGMKMARGVEFSTELCEIARNNCNNFVSRNSPRTSFDIVEGDAAEYSVNDEENIFFLFNPFDRVVFEKVADNISRSLTEMPRDAIMICNNLRYPEVIDGIDQFDRRRDFSYYGHDFVVFSHSLQDKERISTS